MKQYIKNGNIVSSGTPITLADGRKMFSPKESDYLDNGYEVYVQPQIEYSELQLKNQRIAMLKKELSSTDYKAIKYAEGWISEDDYAPVKAERQALRDEINELQEG